MNPEFSLVVPAYESEPSLLVAALDSIRRQTWPNWELIVVDDGSRRVDVAGLVRRWAGSDERVRLVVRPANGGIAEATGDGIDAARGEFIGFVDHDDLLTPDALRRVRRTAATAPDVDAIYSDEAIVDAEGRIVVTHHKPDFSPRRLLGQPYINHFTVLRRTLLAADRPRRELEPSQDFDLLLRVLPRARRVAHVPEVLYHWRAVEGSTATHASAKPGVAVAVLRAVTEAIARDGSAFDATAVPNDPNAVRVVRTAGDGLHVERVAIGATHEMQAAIEASTADVVVFVDDSLDQRASAESPWWQVLATEAAVAHVGFVGPRLVTVGGVAVSNGRVHHPHVHDQFTGIAADDPGPWGAFQVAREVSSVHPLGAAVSRRGLIDAGGLDRDLPLDLAVAVTATRMRLSGRTSLVQPAVVLRRPADARGLDLDGVDPADWRRAVARCPQLEEERFSPAGIFLPG